MLRAQPGTQYTCLLLLLSLTTSVLNISIYIGRLKLPENVRLNVRGMGGWGRRKGDGGGSGWFLPSSMCSPHSTVQKAKAERERWYHRCYGLKYFQYLVTASETESRRVIDSTQKSITILDKCPRSSKR